VAHLSRGDAPGYYISPRRGFTKSLSEMLLVAHLLLEPFNLDQRWSGAGGVSEVVMKQRGMTEAFVVDQHFAQMGFSCRP